MACSYTVGDAPAHPYLTSWLRYGELLAAQYSNPQRMAFHQPSTGASSGTRSRVTVTASASQAAPVRLERRRTS